MPGRSRWTVVKNVAEVGVALLGADFRVLHEAFDQFFDEHVPG